MSHGIPMTRQQAEDYLLALKPLAPVFGAGSYRRGKDIIGDLDIAVLADSLLWEDLVENSRLILNATLLRAGGQIAVLIAPGGHQIDLYRTEPKYLGSMLLFLTGSADHNRMMRIRAMRQNKKLNQYGLFTRDDRAELIARDEMGIYAALDMEYVPPEMR